VTSLTTAIGNHRVAATAGWIAAACLAVLGLGGCQRTAAPDDAKGADASQPAASAATPKEGAAQASEGVTLGADQAAKLGILTQPAQAGDYTPEVGGFGVVIAHDAIAAAVAELTTARAAAVQSRAAAARAQRLAGTPGAMSGDAAELAARQVAADEAALQLAERRLSTVIGAGAPGQIAPADGVTPGDGMLADLASGKLKLLRASFPLGALQGPPPASLRTARLDAAAPGDGQSPGGWVSHPVWNAPADASVPGRSFFAVLKGSDVGEGERLLVWAPGKGPAQRGIAVPAAALVISGGSYWCYVEEKPGVYVRREVATDKPVGNGYLVTQGVAAGDKVVTTAAGLLLARELNPSTEAD
jgi:hypothetical protein